MNPAHDPLSEELLTRWTDGQLNPDELAAVERELAARPALLAEKSAALHLGALMRAHLPAYQEPDSPEFFTSRIMDEVHRSAPAEPARPAAAKSPWWKWLTAPWFTPVASATAVAAIFLAVNGGNRQAVGDDVARTYTPDPNVTARAWYSDDAEALVIDLQGLEAVPDEREIRAFDIASAEPAAPGQPQVFHAATDPGRAVMVLHQPAAGAPPALREVH